MGHGKSHRRHKKAPPRAQEPAAEPRSQHDSALRRDLRGKSYADGAAALAPQRQGQPPGPAAAAAVARVAAPAPAPSEAIDQATPKGEAAPAQVTSKPGSEAAPAPAPVAKPAAEAVDPVAAARQGAQAKYDALAASDNWRGRVENIKLAFPQDMEAKGSATSGGKLKKCKRGLGAATTVDAVRAVVAEIDQLERLVAEYAAAARPIREATANEAARDKAWADLWTELEKAAAHEETGLTQRFPTWNWRGKLAGHRQSRTAKREARIKGGAAETQESLEALIAEAKTSWEGIIAKQEQSVALDQVLADYPTLNAAKGKAIVEAGRGRNASLDAVKAELGAALARQRKLSRSAWYTALNLHGITDPGSVVYRQEADVSYEMSIDGKPAVVTRKQHLSLSGDVIALAAPEPAVDQVAAGPLTDKVLGEGKGGLRLHTTLEVYGKDSTDNPKFYLGDARGQKRQFDGTGAAWPAVARAMKQPLTALTATTRAHVERLVARDGDVGSADAAAWDGDHPEGARAAR